MMTKLDELREKCARHASYLRNRARLESYQPELEFLLDAESNLNKLIAEAAHLEARVAELEKFKEYVHQRLDEAGIPTHPNGKHSKAGCRIGDRLDIALKEIEQ